MPVNLLRDADIRAISLVGKGANRKRFFLFKAGDQDGEVGELGHGRLLKAADWSTVYCVVAEPGAHEDSGIGGPDIEDRWADEDEIRKAAHRFMKNGGLINKLHEDLEPFGDLVENAIALADFDVGGETIRKGSWYIAIEPNAEGKEAIEKGEFNGVSIQGTAMRELVEKRTFTAEQRKKLAGEGKALPDGSFPIVTVADLENAVQALGRAKDSGKAKSHIIRRARALKATDKLPDSWKVKKEDGSTSDPRTVGDVEQKGLIRKIAEKVGLSKEEIEAINADVEKADQTFGEIIARREFEDALPEAFNAFREAVSRAFFPPPDSDGDPVALISESCDEFKSWALEMLEKVPVEKAERAKALGVELPPEGSTALPGTTDSEMGLSETERKEFDGLKKQVDELPEKVAGEFASQLAKALGGKTADEDPTPESIAKAIKDLKGVEDEAELTKQIDSIKADIAKLAEGGSSQSDDPPKPSEDEIKARVAKAFEAEGVDPSLAGVL
jgi:Putative phage serine protease XkdF